MNQTMPHWLTKQAYLSPRQIAIEQVDGNTLTYSQLQRESERFAKKIASLGIQQNDKVAILSTNQLEMVIAVHALTYLQAVIVMLNTRLSKQELEYQLVQSEATLIITTDTLRTKKQLDFSEQKTYEEIATLKEEHIELATHIHLQRPFTMMFTSGTTGLPKAVVHTYGNHWWSAISSSLNLGIQHNDKWLLTLPIFHVGGLSILLRSVIYGTAVYLVEKYDPKIIFKALMEKEVTIISVVTVMLKDLLELLGEDTFPATLRCILPGGGSVPEPILQQVEAKQLPVFQSYGMTETSTQIATLNAEDALKKLGSAGKPLFPAEVKIIEQRKDGVGEIAVKGPMVMEGYFNNEEANKQAFSDGWFKTGDLGYLDEDGFLFVVDRRTDLIISGGENIYPSEIEDVLLGMNGVLEAAVVGKADEKWGQVPVACVVRSHEALLEETIQEYVRQKLASYKVPKRIYFLESLPRNASNKIMRHKLTDWVARNMK